MFLIELVLVLVVKCLSCKSLPSKVVVIPTSCRGPSTFSTWIYEMLIRLKRTKDNEAKSWIKFQWKIFLLHTDKDSCRVVSSFFYLVYVCFKNLLCNFIIKQVNIDWKMNFVCHLLNFGLVSHFWKEFNFVPYLDFWLNVHNIKIKCNIYSGVFLVLKFGFLSLMEFSFVNNWLFLLRKFPSLKEVDQIDVSASKIEIPVLLLMTCIQTTPEPFWLPKNGSI